MRGCNQSLTEKERKERYNNQRRKHPKGHYLKKKRYLSDRQEPSLLSERTVGLMKEGVIKGKKSDGD